MPYEYAILCAMDDAYCSEMNKELSDARERQKERQRIEAEAAKSKGRRRGRR